MVCHLAQKFQICFHIDKSKSSTLVLNQRATKYQSFLCVFFRLLQPCPRLSTRQNAFDEAFMLKLLHLDIVAHSLEPDQIFFGNPDIFKCQLCMITTVVTQFLVPPGSCQSRGICGYNDQRHASSICL